MLKILKNNSYSFYVQQAEITAFGYLYDTSWDTPTAIYNLFHKGENYEKQKVIKLRFPERNYLQSFQPKRKVLSMDLS
jgi:hypothetical protein